MTCGVILEQGVVSFMPRLAALSLLLLMGISHLAQIAGRVLDRTGKPMPNVRVIYTNEDTGKTYKFKTNKKGEFVGVGIEQGVYRIEITAKDGTSLYKTRRNVVEPNTPEVKPDTNFLNADLSVLSVTDLPGIKANVLDKPLTEQQKQMIRASNANVEQMNVLIVSLHAAIDAHEWPKAKDILAQLLAADPNRWEFYQNLGTVQTQQSDYEGAAQSYERGIQLAQSGITSGRQPDKSDISLMMIYAGDANARIGNMDKAVAFYSKAAEVSPDPATAYFNICRAQRAIGNIDAAKQACSKVISIDTNRWDAYQILGGMQQNAGEDQLAIETYQKGIWAAEKMAVISVNSSQAKVGIGQMLDSQGNLYAHLKRFDDAIAVFSRAVEYAAYPPREYFNICAAYYDTDRMDAAVEACDKAIGGDPRMADAYWVKASALYGKSKLDHGKLAVPPGTQEALSKYLEINPQGDHAADARQMLSKIGSTVDTTLKSSKQ